MIESRFFIEENEGVISEKSTPQKNNDQRRFGTQLSTNIIASGMEKSLTPKRIVRVKRAISSSRSKENMNRSLNRSISNEVVVFSPGPVGLQLEQSQPNSSNGCRIVRFVDGGPKNPGQARKSGKLKPGDLVTMVEANGVVGSSYDDIVEILKDSCATRTVTFQSVWSLPILESRTKSGMSVRSKREKTPERPLTPNTHNLSSSKRENPISEAMSPKFETLLPPPFLLGSDKDEEVGPDWISLIQSPSHAALLPHVRTPLSHAVRSPHVRTPPSHLALLSSSSKLPYFPRHHGGNKYNPTILASGDRFATPPVSSPIPTWSAPKPSSRQNPCYLIARHITTEGLNHHVGKDGTEKEWATHSSPCVSGAPSYANIFMATKIKKGALFSPSSVRKLSKTENKDEVAETSIMSLVFERLRTGVAPIVANSSNATRSWNARTTGRLKDGDDWDVAKSHTYIAPTNTTSSQTQGLDYNMKAQVLQELSCMKIAKEVDDITTQEMERSINKNNLLKFEFNEKLHFANSQHTTTEKELKKLYERHEAEILTLETKNRKLEEKLKDSRGAVSVDSIHLSTVQETLHRTMGKLESKQKQVEELKCKNGEFQERVSELERELDSFREKEKNLLLELEMSRTMTKEMERLLLQIETSSAESVEELRNHLVEKEEELKTNQSLVTKLKEEGVNLLNHMESLETGVKALDNENDELRRELERTKKELSESKNETAAIHETLLQNLESGASCVDVILGCDESEGENTNTSLRVKEKMNDVEIWNRASRCALVVFVIRENILGELYSEYINKLDTYNNDLLITLEKSLERSRQGNEEVEKRDIQMLTLKQAAEEMGTALSAVTKRRNEEYDENFKHLLKIGICFDPQLMNTCHLISTMRRNTELSQVALSRMERDMEISTSQFEQKLNLCNNDLQISIDSENAIKSKLDATMEKLARTSIKLRRIEGEKTENEASLRDSEEALSQAVDVIKKLEAAVAMKDTKLHVAEAQINALKENEELVSLEHVGLCEKILSLEERLTELTESMCKLRRTCNSMESQKIVLETRVRTMTLEKEELQHNVSTLKDHFGKCRAELEQANVTNLLLESDLMDLLDKSEEKSWRELSTTEMLVLEVSHEKKVRHTIQQQLLESAQMVESLKHKSFGLQVAFLASVGAYEAKTQSLQDLNKNLEGLFNEQLRVAEIEIENFRVERQNLKKEISQLTHRCTAETQDLRCNDEVLENALDTSKVQHLASRANLQNVHATGDSPQTDAQHSQIERQRKDIRNAQQEVSLLTSRVEKARFTHCASLAAIGGMNRLYSQTVEVVAQKNSQIVSLADQIGNIEDELRCIENNYELENCLLHKNIDEQKRTIRALMAASVTEHVRSRKIEAKVRDFAAAILEMQTKLDCARSKLLLAEADHLESLAHKNENEDLKENIRTLERKIGRLEKECNSKTEEICSLRESITVGQDIILHSTKMFDAERQRLLGAILDMAQEILKLKGDIDDIQEEHINELESTKILIQDLRWERDSIFIALEESKKDKMSEKLRNLSYKKELDSLQTSFDELHSEKLVNEASICQLEKRIVELVENMNICQKESSEWQSKAKSYESQVQEMTTKYHTKVDEIAGLHEVNETLLSRLNKSGDTIALLKRQETNKESELKSHEVEVAKLKEEKKEALWRWDKANIQVNVLQNTSTQLREKLETLTKENDDLLRNMCITEAALAGLRRGSNQGIKFLNNMKLPDTSIGGMEGRWTHRSSMVTTESVGSDQRSTSQELMVVDLSNSAASQQNRDTTDDERISRRFQVLLTRKQEISSRELSNRIGDERTVGARLLSLVVEQRMRMGVACAFRKWSCVNNAMKATSQLHRTSKELSHQLYCTREKLLVLKSHIKANSMQAKENEPRLRMVLKPVTDQQRSIDPGETINL